MSGFAVTRSYHFSAAHQLANAALSDEENARIYGQCFRPHGHNYVLEVTVAGVRAEARRWLEEARAEGIDPANAVGSEP